MNILFSSIGRRVELIECFRRDAKALGIDLHVIAVDSNAQMSAGCYVADRSFTVPHCDDSAFIPEVISICRNEDIHLIVPTTDIELMPYAINHGLIRDMGAHVAISSPGVIHICNDKLKAAQTLKSCDIGSPDTVSLEQLVNEPECLPWPVIAKPRYGANSNNVYIARTCADLSQCSDSSREFVCQHAIDGAEYTVNVFFDLDGQCRNVTAHRRYEVRGGAVTKAITESSPVLSRIARRLAVGLNTPQGAFCFQAMRDKSGRYTVHDLNARFGGGFPLAHRAGARYPAWLMQERLGTSPAFTAEGKPGIAMLRYDAAVFVEVDSN